jgi:ATP-dependent DNA helicase RecG
MAAWAQEAGLPRPEILEIPGAVVVRFAVRTPEKTPEKTLEKTPEAILELLRESPELSVSELATRLDRSASAINRAIRKLRESGRLQRIGPDKGGRWKVIR